MRETIHNILSGLIKFLAVIGLIGVAITMFIFIFFFEYEDTYGTYALMLTVLVISIRAFLYVLRYILYIGQ